MSGIDQPPGVAEQQAEQARANNEARAALQASFKAAIVAQSPTAAVFPSATTVPVKRVDVAPVKRGLPATVQKIDFYRHNAGRLQKRHGESLGQMLVRTIKKR